MKGSICDAAHRRSGETIVAAAPALLLAVPMVQVFIHLASDTLASIPILLAAGASAAVGPFSQLRSACPDSLTPASLSS